MKLSRLFLIAPVLLAQSAQAAPGDCDHYNKLKSPFFGDLHVHTARSFDAAAVEVRTSPAQAYDFAKGKTIPLPPYDGEGKATRSLKLSRPLDFAAVTDHAEFFAETALCNDQASGAWNSPACITYRAEFLGDSPLRALLRLLSFGIYDSMVAPPPSSRLCRWRPSLCGKTRDGVWEEMQQAAEAAYDRSSTCGFTSFIGYEWTGTTGGNNLHRNVIFAGSEVPDKAISYLDVPQPEKLLQALDEACTNKGNGCRVLTIPHNSNLSGGQIFVPRLTDEGRPNGEAYSKEDSERRQRLEPLVEIYQAKGASECLNLAGNPLASQDEFCEFERRALNVCRGEPDDAEGCTPLCSDTAMGLAAMQGFCTEPSAFVRSALRLGLTEEVRNGVNPFRYGFIASTDTHNGTPGATEEDNFKGHHGIADSDTKGRIGLMENNAVGLVSGENTGPGGLAVVWAEENTRESLFAAMQRRETYGTSGTRIVTRFFAGDYPADACGRQDMIALGYDKGVPMGGLVDQKSGIGQAPVFIVSASSDPGSKTPLERIQIIRGRINGDGTEEKVFDVVVAPEGRSALCHVWQDPDYDPQNPAFYYSRVLEVPTARWSDHDCREAASDCGHLKYERRIRERAWTSPIWFSAAL